MAISNDVFDYRNTRFRHSRRYDGMENASFGSEAPAVVSESATRASDVISRAIRFSIHDKS